MRIEVNFASPTYGGGSLYLVGDFLVDGLPDVGRAIEKIEADVLLRSEPRAPHRPVMGEEFDELLGLVPGGDGIGPDHPEWSQFHEERRSKGPSLTFRRVARRVSIRLISDLSELDVFGTATVTPKVFAAATREVVAALGDLPRRIRPADDFDVRTLLAFVQARLEVLPRNQRELDRTLKYLLDAELRRWQAMDEWEKLDIDWSVYSAEARERFADPFFFDPGDDEAPHGNDAGADFLAAYVTERPKNGLALLDAHVVGMGYRSLSDLATVDSWEHDQLVIAAVFADLMVRGSTSAELIRLALQALDRREAQAPSPRNSQMRQVLA